MFFFFSFSAYHISHSRSRAASIETEKTGLFSWTKRANFLVGVAKRFSFEFSQKQCVPRFLVSTLTSFTRVGKIVLALRIEKKKSEKTEKTVPHAKTIKEHYYYRVRTYTEPGQTEGGPLFERSNFRDTRNACSRTVWVGGGGMISCRGVGTRMLRSTGLERLRKE